MKKTFFLLSIVLLFSVSTVSAGENLGDFILHHVTNSHSWSIIPGMEAIPLPHGWMVGGIDMGISLHVLMILLAAVLLLLILQFTGSYRNDLPKSRWGHAIEAIVIYMRDEVIIPNVGKKDAKAWTPFFLTVFFFILGINLIGLIPGFVTATGNINLTAALAIMIFIVFNLSGIMRNGPIHYFTNLIPKGIPIPVLFIMVPIELLGLLTKAFALAIRLFANMSAGHIIILSLLGLISIFDSYFLAPGFMGFTLFIYLIEILVAFLQAYVFVLLSSLFVGMALHQEH